MTEPARRTRRVASSMQAPTPPRTSARARLLVGGLFVGLAAVAFAGSTLATRAQRHAYDPGALPPATVRLTQGHVYHLSTPGGVTALKATGALATGTQPACAVGPPGGTPQSITLENVSDDDRDLTVWASFHSPVSGEVTVLCSGIQKLFVDDADSASFDYAGLLVVVSSVFGVIGVGAFLSGFVERLPARNYESPAADPASAAETSSS